MIKLTEWDLVKIREALEKPSLTEAIAAVEVALSEIGYTEARQITQNDNNSPQGLESLFINSNTQVKM